MVNKKFDLYKEPYIRKADNKYYGEIILEDSLKIHFSIISDNLYLTPIGKGEDLLCGGCSYHYIKELN